MRLATGRQRRFPPDRHGSLNRRRREQTITSLGTRLPLRGLQAECRRLDLLQHIPQPKPLPGSHPNKQLRVIRVLLQHIPTATHLLAPNPTLTLLTHHPTLTLPHPIILHHPAIRLIHRRLGTSHPGMRHGLHHTWRTQSQLLCHLLTMVLHRACHRSPWRPAMILITATGRSPQHPCQRLRHRTLLPTSLPPHQVQRMAPHLHMAMPPPEPEVLQQTGWGRPLSIPAAEGGHAPGAMERSRTKFVQPVRLQPL
mmetsp:Transcript_96104/g.228883  ORF Transcript_96104/g.228883 Transcript_96104/m.228883 type:complete len:254 (-) Transcript_96104:149-910(-)